MKKRSVVIAGHATSLSLEVEFYDALERLAKQRNMSVAALIKQIDFSRNGNLSSAVRVFILKALEENGIEIDAIGGTSAGSIVAALYAMGYKPYYIYVIFKKYAQEIINIGNAPIINGIGKFVKCKKIYRF